MTNHFPFENSDGFEVINTVTGEVVDWFLTNPHASDRAGFLSRPDQTNVQHVVRPARRLVTAGIRSSDW